MKKRLIALAKKTKIGKYVLSILYIPKAKRMVVNFLGKSFANNKQLIRDVARSSIYSKYSMVEYFGYGFYNKTEEERNEFVSDNERVIFSEKVNPAKNAEIFNNKVLTYDYFKPFYKRNICCLNNDIEKDKEPFEEFLKAANGKFIAKTLDGSFGKGVKIFSFDKNDTAEELLHILYEEYNCKLIVEDVIVQDERMAVFHPESLNSVRMPTVRYPDGTTEVINPFFRVGRGDSIVDNAGAGGIICAVDAATGKVIAAADEKGKKYDVHPDSHKEIIGYEIPCWNEAVEFAKKLANVLPDNIYSAWDIALTDDGWVMVEGNYRGQFVWQIPTQQGFRNEMQGILEKLGK